MKIALRGLAVAAMLSVSTIAGIAYAVAATLALYALEGAIGLPVFAEFKSGVMLASFGYVLGFIAAAWSRSATARRPAATARGIAVSGGGEVGQTALGLGHGQGLVQRGDDACVVQHIQGAAGALDGFLAPQHVGPAWSDQHQVVKPHGFHGTGGGAHIAGVAGVDQDKTGLHGRAGREGESGRLGKKGLCG